MPFYGLVLQNFLVFHFFLYFSLWQIDPYPLGGVRPGSLSKIIFVKKYFFCKNYLGKNIFLGFFCFLLMDFPLFVFYLYFLSLLGYSFSSWRRLGQIKWILPPGGGGPHYPCIVFGKNFWENIFYPCLWSFLFQN